MDVARRGRVWFFVAAIAVMAAGVWASTQSAPAFAWHAHGIVVWLLLFAAFAITEAYVVHVDTGRHAHSFSFTDVPLVVGLFVAGPGTVLTSRLLGAAFALVVVRRQRPVKVVFNLAQLALGIAAAMAVWRYAGSHHIESQSAWLAAVAVVATVALVSSAAVIGVIWMDAGRRTAQTIRQTVVTDISTAVAQAAFTLTALSVVQVDWRGLWAVAVVAGYVAYGHRSQVTLQRRHGALQRLNDVAGQLGERLESGAIAQEIVAGAVHALSAARADLVLVGDDNDSVSYTYSVEEVLDDAPVITAPLVSHGRSLGHLRVTGTGLRAFGPDDQQLLDGLAQHASKVLANGHLADELRAQVAENEHQATHDSLTGLSNRLLFQRVVDAKLAAGEPLAVLLLDLDQFKDVNDTLGHLAGDQLLRDVGRRLEAALPPGASIARLGGDEFTVLLDGSDETAALAAAQAARESLLHPLHVRSVDVSVDVSVDASIGIALAPQHGETCDDLLRRADVAMYAAKSERRGVLVYDENIDHNDAAHLALVADLRDAVAAGTLELHYQPKIDLLRPNAPLSVEALARWNHPERGAVSPDRFIAIAEQTGLIGPLTDFVVDTALAQCRRWLDDGLDIGVSVNVSARVLRDEGFPDRLVEALRAAAVPAGRLTVEITETAVMDDVENSIDVLWRLRRAGVRLSIDDLGVGQSSLTYLKRLPVHEVKIDKSFVLTMADDPHDDAIVCAVVGLAHRLGMEVVAEGVETRPIRDRLVAIGCDIAQGFWFSRPLPGADVVRWRAGHELPSQRPTTSTVLLTGAARGRS